MTIVFARYDHKTSKRMLSLYYHELMGKSEEYWGRKYLMVDYIVDEVLDKIKMMVFVEKLDDTKILIDTDDRLSDEVSLKNVVISISCVIKDTDKFYPQLFLSINSIKIVKSWQEVLKDGEKLVRII